MAGKSSRGRNKKASHNTRKATESVVSTDGHSKGNRKPVEEQRVDSNRVPPSAEIQATKPEVKESENETSEDQTKQGGVILFPVTVKTQFGEKLELKLSLNNTVMDVRQFLLDAPQTCFFTCYDLLMHTKDGSTHHLEDDCCISEVADITSGDCSIAMIAGIYDDRSIRAHVQHTQKLLISLSTLHSSLSTLLQLQHETGLNATANSGDLKDAVDLKLVEDVSDSLLNLLSPSREIVCVKSIVFSQFNLPDYRRLLGDLIYLDVATLEGRKYCITGTTTTFYVNSSSGKTLNPKPIKDAFKATTLVGLLENISLKFKKALREMLERKASAHPYEIIQPLLPPNSWIGLCPAPENSLGLGSESVGMQRDWNEELQNSRELPHASPEERILRDRALYKVSSEFVDAATSSAIGFINGRIPPIERKEPNCCFHNNILLSYVVDAGLDQLAVSEQFTYATSNSYLKGTKACQEADVPGLYYLAMAIVDYKGRRVVAQSVPPGMLQGVKPDSRLYGSDDGKEIFWNEGFHKKVLEASKQLRMKEHTVLDGSGNAFQIAAPAECEGIVGPDDRYYLCDLRVAPRDTNYTGPNSKFCILRPELITAFCQNKSEHKSDDIRFNPNVFTEFKLAGSPEEISADEDSVQKVSLYLKDVVVPQFIQDLCALEVSPMDGQTLTEELHAHGINVRYIGTVAYGTKHLPHLWDLCSNEIIVRCAKHLLKDILRDTADHDISQSVAHFFNCLFGDVHTASGKSVGKNQKNLFLHQALGKSTKHHSGSKVVSWFSLSSESLWSYIVEFAKVKYQFELPEDARSHVKKISVLRNLCLKVGVAIAVKKYDLSVGTPFQTSDILNLQPVVKHAIPVCSVAKELVETGKAELAEVGVAIAAKKYDLSVDTPFQTSDIFYYPPAVNHSIPLQAVPDLVYISFAVAFSLLQHVTGPMHHEVANCCCYLAAALYQAGDMAAALMQQHEQVIINERCLGLDHPATAYSYVKMAQIYHRLDQSELALRHISRALVLVSLSSGLDHPYVSAIYIEVANIYQDIGNLEVAFGYLEEALEKNKRLLGEEHIQTAECYHALAIAFDREGAYDLALQHEEKTLDILMKQLEWFHPRTRESLIWMEKIRVKRMEKIRVKRMENLYSTLHTSETNAVCGQATTGADPGGQGVLRGRFGKN